jgi:hypothetical protein
MSLKGFSDAIRQQELAHTLAVVFNLYFGRSPLDFGGLLAD